MKKLIVSLFVMLFLFGNISYASENNTEAELRKNYILKRGELKKDVLRGEKYVQTIDSFIEKYQNDTKRLREIQGRIAKAIPQLDNFGRQGDIKIVLEYIDYKIELLLFGRQEENNIKNDSPKNETIKMSKKEIINLDIEQLNKYLISLSEEELKNTLDGAFSEKQIKDFRKLYTESLATYSNDAKDAKVLSDLRTLISTIETNITLGKNKASDFIGNITEDKSSNHIEWIIGNPNYETLLTGAKKDWLDSYGYEYKIAYYNDGSNIYLQVLGFTGDNPRELTANIKSTYMGENQFSLFENYKTGNTYDTSNTRIYNKNEVQLNNKELYQYIIYHEWYLKENHEILETYENNSKNSKTISDLRTLAASVEIGLTDGSVNFDKLIGNPGNSYSNSTLGEIYTGTPNYPLLRQNSKDFKSLWDKEYKIAYSIHSKLYSFYQILGLNKTDEGDWEVVIKGNYYQIDNTYPVGLFQHPKTGEYLKNGDIIKANDMK